MAEIIWDKIFITNIVSVYFLLKAKVKSYINLGMMQTCEYEFQTLQNPIPDLVLTISSSSGIERTPCLAMDTSNFHIPGR